MAGVDEEETWWKLQQIRAQAVPMAEKRRLKRQLQDAPTLRTRGLAALKLSRRKFFSVVGLWLLVATRVTLRTDCCFRVHSLFIASPDSQSGLLSLLYWLLSYFILLVLGLGWKIQPYMNPLYEIYQLPCTSYDHNSSCIIHCKIQLKKSKEPGNSYLCRL